MVKGNLRFLPLKGGGITVTIDISEDDTSPAIIQELAGMFGRVVVVGSADEAVLSRHDEIHEARVSLDVIAGNTEAIRSALEVAEARLPLDEAQEADAGEQGGSSEF